MPVALVARVFDTQANSTFEATYERFPVRIGRNQLNDLHIDRPYVSQFHAAIDVRDRQIFVRDLGSTNGTMFNGYRLVRDQPIDITQSPIIQIGPTRLDLGLVEAAPKKREQAAATVLDASFNPAQLRAAGVVQPGGEDPFVRQLLPYVEMYRTAWGNVYRVLYDHLARLPPDYRVSYIKRVANEQAAVAGEQDFLKIAQYYGVDAKMLGELGAPQAAFAALAELQRTLAPGAKDLDDVGSVLGFARRVRDSMEVFLKCFVSLRDGYREFESEVLAREKQQQQGDQVATAKDAKELATVLLTPAGSPEGPRQLHDIFVDVMSHQVALLNGVMEGVRSLLTKLAPKTLEEELEKKGKKGGIFSSKYEELWKLYEVRHGDYSGEDKETFLIIFGPQFSRAYAATAGEDVKTSGEAVGKNLRFTISPNQLKQRG